MITYYRCPKCNCRIITKNGKYPPATCINCKDPVSLSEWIPDRPEPLPTIQQASGPLSVTGKMLILPVTRDGEEWDKFVMEHTFHYIKMLRELPAGVRRVELVVRGYEK